MESTDVGTGLQEPAIFTPTDGVPGLSMRETTVETGGIRRESLSYPWHYLHIKLTDLQITGKCAASGLSKRHPSGEFLV